MQHCPTPHTTDSASQSSDDMEEPEEKVKVQGRGFSCKSFLCDPHRWMHRFLMLGMMCFLSFGSYYVYDNPAALQKTILNVSW